MLAMLDIMDMLVLLDEMGIDERTIMREVKIKHRGTITNWYNGTKPRPKHRVKLTRFFRRMESIKRMKIPTDAIINEACWNRPKEWDWKDEEIVLLAKNSAKFRFAYHRGREKFLEKEFDNTFRLTVVAKWHPNEFVRLHFESKLTT